MEDLRAQRHEQTRQRIVAAAWRLSREQGLTGWSMRDLGAAVGMRAPSLYGYVAGKDALYDEMFAAGNRDLLAALAPHSTGTAPTRDRLRAGAHTFFSFAVADPARMQLMFLRVIPSFVPSPGSMALARGVVDAMSAALAELGATDQRGADLFSATLTGLAVQHLSNDPGGHRWADLVDLAVDAVLAAVASPDPSRQS